jgi:hypothetical protein
MRNGVEGVVANVVLSSVGKILTEIWIGYSGPSGHFFNNNDGLYDEKVTFEERTVINGNMMILEKKENVFVKF